MFPDDDAHRKWKRASTNMYDWMTNHHSVWPALACRFGPREEDNEARFKQTIYVSEQVAKEEKTPNKLVVHSVMIPKEFHAPLDHINTWKENQKSPLFGSQPEKVIHHPGECNKIREIHGHDHIVVTHSDCAEVYVWDLEKQPDANASTKARGRGSTNSPDLLLTGHQAQAPFALTTSLHSPSVASGGEDHAVLVWNLEDSNQISVLTNRASSERRGGELPARVTLKGHSATVTDVCFYPGTDHLLASAADDHIVKLWDTRQKDSILQIARPHGDCDVLSMDWSREGYLATGDMAGRVCVHDMRVLEGSASGDAGRRVFDFPQLQGEEKGVNVINFNPTKRGWLAAGGDDGRITVYDTNRPSAPDGEPDNLPSQLMMQHVGHLGGIMDLQWCPTDPHMCMGVSNDSESFKGGGAVQMWRVCWLMYADVDVVEEHFRHFQSWLENGRMEDMEKMLEKHRREIQRSAATPSPEAAPPGAAADAAAGPAPQENEATASAAAFEGEQPGTGAADAGGADSPGGDGAVEMED